MWNLQFNYPEFTPDFSLHSAAFSASFSGFITSKCLAANMWLTHNYNKLCWKALYVPHSEWWSELWWRRASEDATGIGAGEPTGMSSGPSEMFPMFLFIHTAHASGRNHHCVHPVFPPNQNLVTGELYCWFLNIPITELLDSYTKNNTQFK